MIRPSALQVAQHCELASVLASEHPGTSPEAERGLAVDKEACRELAGGEEAQDPDARALVWWTRQNLYDRHVQEEVQLRHPETSEPITRPGRPDVWGSDHLEGDLVIVDFKKREQYYASSLAPPDESLQLHAYGIAVAQAIKAPSYRSCMLLFGDGAVQELWSRTYTPETWAPILDHIVRIHVREKARGDKRPVGFSGPHCTECYQRRHCPHWVLPATAAESALAPLALPGGITRQNSERVLLAWMQLGELYDRLKPLLQDFAEHEGPITVGEEKIWGPQVVRGKRSASVRDLEAAGLEGHIRQGEPTVRFTLRRR